MTPEMELAKVIGAHYPDKMSSRRPLSEPQKRIIGEARADLGFDVANHDAWPDVEPPGGFDASFECGQSGHRLEWIAGSDQPPDAIELKPPQRQPGDEGVALVRRVERSPQQPDAHPRRKRRQARNGRHEAVCWASSSAWRSAVSASMISSRPSPSIIRSS